MEFLVFCIRITNVQYCTHISNLSNINFPRSGQRGYALLAIQYDRRENRMCRPIMTKRYPQILAECLPIPVKIIIIIDQKVDNKYLPCVLCLCKTQQNQFRMPVNCVSLTSICAYM